jgi:hypothetical protein
MDEADVGVLDRDRVIGPRRAVALHVRILAPVLAHTALVELREPRRAVRIGRALAVAGFRLNSIIGEIILRGNKRVQQSVAPSGT